MARNGLELINPTSINYSGTSASISANGSVEFISITTLSLNGVFTADYDNYMAVMRMKLDGDDNGLNIRFRSSGTDNTDASYTIQRWYSVSTSNGASRYTGYTYIPAGTVSNDYRDGKIAHFYGPYLTEPTAYRDKHMTAYTGAYIDNYSAVHSGSTSFDGVTFYPAGNTLSGRVAIYGLRK